MLITLIFQPINTKSVVDWSDRPWNLSLFIYSDGDFETNKEKKDTEI